jgi:hypothetical protein
MTSWPFAPAWCPLYTRVGPPSLLDSALLSWGVSFTTLSPLEKQPAAMLQLLDTSSWSHCNLPSLLIQLATNSVWHEPEWWRLSYLSLLHGASIYSRVQCLPNPVMAQLAAQKTPGWVNGLSHYNNYGVPWYFLYDGRHRLNISVMICKFLSCITSGLYQTKPYFCNDNIIIRHKWRRQKGVFF